MTTKTKIKINTDAANKPKVGAVLVTHDPGEANRLLQLGWDLLHSGCCHIDNHGLNAKPVFILGK